MSSLLENLYLSIESRDGSVHRSLSTNTTCRNLNNFNNNHAAHKTFADDHDSCESPKVQNMEEISLMSLEKDLKHLEEQNNNVFKKKNKLSDDLSSFFQRHHSRFRN